MSPEDKVGHMENIPRIESVKVDGPSTVRVRWKGQRSADIVDLAGWIATGGEILAPLKDPGVFTRAGVGGYGSAVEWDDGDLAIDAVHLKLLADAQRPFDNNQLREWQLLVRISNAEAADLVGIFGEPLLLPAVGHRFEQRDQRRRRRQDDALTGAGFDQRGIGFQRGAIERLAWQEHEDEFRRRLELLPIAFGA